MEQIDSDVYIQHKIEKQRKSDAIIDGKIRSNIQKIERLHRENENLAAIKEGTQRSLDRDAEATDEERLARAYKHAIRTYLAERRFALTGSREVGKGRSTVKSRVFDFIYKRWSQRGKPATGIALSRSTLAKAAKCSEREVDRALRRLRAHVASTRNGRGKKRGRPARRFTFPLFPTFLAFALTWSPQYGREVYNETI